MVKITHRPLKEIVISEVVYYDSPEKLAYSYAPLKLTGQPVILQWADGVVFIFTLIPPDTDRLMDDFLDGIIYWGGVMYSLMPQYHHTITLSPETGGTIEIGVQDASANTNLVKAASWLKEDAKNKKYV